MSIATIASKGQVTLPKEIRIKLHLEAGEKIDFRLNEEAGTATLVPIKKHIEDVFGILHRPRQNKRITIEDMDKVICKTGDFPNDI